MSEDNEEFYMPPRIVELWEELIEKSIKTGNIVSKKELFSSLENAVVSEKSLAKDWLSELKMKKRSKSCKK